MGSKDLVPIQDLTTSARIQSGVELNPSNDTITSFDIEIIWFDHEGLKLSTLSCTLDEGIKLPNFESRHALAGENSISVRFQDPSGLQFVGSDRFFGALGRGLIFIHTEKGVKMLGRIEEMKKMGDFATGTGNQSSTDDEVQIGFKGNGVWTTRNLKKEEDEKKKKKKF